MSLYFEISDCREGIVISLRGEADVRAAETLRGLMTAALALTDGSIEIDLAALQFLDCGGIGTLVRARGNARGDGRVLFLSHPRGIVSRILEISNTAVLLTRAGI